MNKKILFLILSLTIITSTVFVYSNVFAANQITIIAGNVKKALFTIGSTLIVVGWVIAGILYLTSIGKPEKMQVAQKAIIAAIIGTLMIILASSAVSITEIIRNVILQGV